MEETDNIVETKTELVRQLIDFFDWLGEKTRVMISTKKAYLFAAKKFIIETKDIKDPNCYNEFLMQYCQKKRSTLYYSALKYYVRWKFSSKEDRELRDTILETMRYLRPPANPTPKKPVVVIDDHTIKQIIDGLRDEKHRLIARIQSELGIRAGDALRIRRGAIRYEPYKDRILMAIDVVGKGDRMYKMFVFDESLQAQIEEYIRKYWTHNDYYFIDKMHEKNDDYQNYKANYGRYLADMNKSCFRLGIKAHTWASHDFRRTIARKVWSATHDILLLKEMLHHQMVETSVRYVRQSGLAVQELQEQLYNKKV